MATLSGLQALDGSVVLVRQTIVSDPGTPVTMRGQLRVHHNHDDPGDGRLTAEVVLSFPAVFSAPIAELILPLSDAEVTALLATDNHGTFEYTYVGSLADVRPRSQEVEAMTPEESRSGDQS